MSLHSEKSGAKLVPQRSCFGKWLLFAKRVHFFLKIVPQRGLFCGQKRCLWGAVLAPLFFWVYSCQGRQKKGQRKTVVDFFCYFGATICLLVYTVILIFTWMTKLKENGCRPKNTISEPLFPVRIQDLLNPELLQKPMNIKCSYIRIIMTHKFS